MTRPIFHPVEHNTPEWLALRRTGVGASEIPIITGDAPWGDVRTVYQDKLGYAADSIANRAMQAGQRFEAAILRWYSDDFGLRAQRVHGVFRHPEEPIVLASLDGMTARRPRRVVEVKVANSPDDGWGLEGTDQVPDHYREQVEWEMLAAGVELADVAVYFMRQRRLARYTVARDRDLGDQLLGYGIDFWQHVEARTPPQPPARHRSSLIALRADEIEPTPELVELAARYAEASVAATEADDALAIVKGELRMTLADVGGTRGLLPDGRAFSVVYRPNRDGTEVAWQLLANELRERLVDAGVPTEELDQLVAAYTSTKPGARPLRVTVTRERKHVA